MKRTPGNRYQGWTSDNYEILNGEGNVVARCTEWDFEDQDAAYIVRAVNCHERLVELVKRLMRAAFNQATLPGLDEVNALLAEAEGGR